MKNEKKVDVIIQARIGSTRLKGKVLKKHRGLTPLKIMTERLKHCKKIKDVIICTTRLLEDNRIVKFCKKENIRFYRGSKNDVLSRYYETAKKFRSEVIVRVTSDCPFVDYRIINNMLSTFLNSKMDYYANTYPLPTTYPDGMDIEIFTFNSLKLANKYSTKKSEKEHVTVYIRSQKKFKTLRTDLTKDKSNYRLTVDYLKDYNLFKNLVDKFKNKIFFINMNEIITFLDKNPRLTKYQNNILKNEKFINDLKRDKI